MRRRHGDAQAVATMILCVIVVAAILAVIGWAAHEDEECTKRGGVYKYRIGCVDPSVLR